MTLGFAADLGAKFLDIYTATLKPSVSWNWGESATITGSVTSGYTPTQLPPPGVTWTWKIVRRAYWRHAHGFALRYAAHGYEGLEDYDWIGFVSPTKEQAALSDYDQDERYEGPGAPVI